MKINRQEEILDIISNKEVATQVGLKEELAKRGIEVTQATISRDIKELNLVKSASGRGRRRHFIQQSEAPVNWAEKFRPVFLESVIRIDYAQNIVAVKCHAGMGNAACAAIDALELEGVVGTLAGDDTAFLLMRDEEQARAMLRQLEERLVH